MGEFNTLKMFVDHVEVPQQYMFRDRAHGSVSVKDKPMCRVVRNSSTYAETTIKLLETLHEGEATEEDLEKVHARFTLLSANMVDKENYQAIPVIQEKHLSILCSEY